MTERQFFEKCIPQIAEIIVEARKMTSEEYYDWKERALCEINEKSKNFMEKTFKVIEQYLPQLQNL